MNININININIYGLFVVDNAATPYGIAVGDENAQLSISRIDQYARQVVLEVTMSSDENFGNMVADGFSREAGDAGVSVGTVRPPSPSTGMGALASRPRHRSSISQAENVSVTLVISYPPFYPTSGIPSFTVRAPTGSKLRQKELVAELTKELTAIAENVCNERQGTALTSTL